MRDIDFRERMIYKGLLPSSKEAKKTSLAGFRVRPIICTNYTHGHNEDCLPLINKSKGMPPKKFPQEILIMGAELGVKISNNIPVKFFDRCISGKMIIFPLH